MFKGAGIYVDMDADDYFADPCPEPSLTQSLLGTLIERSPLHAWCEHPRLNRDYVREDATKFDVGNAAHRLLIGRGKEIVSIDFDSWTKKAKEARADYAKLGVIAVLAEQFERAAEMARAVRHQLRQTEHEDAFQIGHGEAVACWQDDGFWCRTMMDWLSSDLLRIYDLKTTAMSCAPHEVADRPSLQGWDIQGAWHAFGLDTLKPETSGRRRHLFVNVEDQPPHALSVVQLSEADLTMGHKKIVYGSTRWKICMARKRWPGYPTETVMSHPRSYTESKWLEREISEAARERHPGNILLAG